MAFVHQLPKIHKIILSFLLVVLVGSAFFPPEPANASRNSTQSALELGKRYPLTLDINALTDVTYLDDEPEWQQVKVQNGDNLAKIFSRLGLSAQDTYQVSSAGPQAKKLLKLRPGESLFVRLDENKNFQQLRYEYSLTEALIISKENKKYSTNIDKKSPQKRLAYSQGEIKSSFWNAGITSGLTEAQIMNLAGIFGWDIDFALELRQGDNFIVVFEEEYLDGEFVGYGDIVAAEFTNQGETFTALRHSDGDYYTPEGRSMRKSFLRAPVSFKYISSNFNPRRFHPVQKRWKAHRGVDYAADTGTPVMAAGNGKVIKSGYDKFNGHHVFIKHGEKYVTKYIHFSKRAVKVGQNVKQGQTIGYVGSTGLAAGPHLHYEFLVDGVHRNPRTVSLPKAQPIKNDEKAAFLLTAKHYLTHLTNNRRIMLAVNR
jgi:murein DD-endopeptidase MepM/ murein hydrolase activator NlpD